MDEGTFARFAHFIYTGDYPPPSCDTIKDPPSVEDDHADIEQAMVPAPAEPEPDLNMGVGFISSFGNSKEERKKRLQVTECVGFHDLVYNTPCRNCMDPLKRLVKYVAHKEIQIAN